MSDYTPPKVGDVQYGRREYVQHLDGMREWSFTSTPQASTSDGERDAFLNATLPLLIGDCVHIKDHDTWCGGHDSLWLPGNEHCARYTDQDSFADSVIEAWEGRPAAAAARNWQQGTIDDLAAQVRVLEDERDG